MEIRREPPHHIRMNIRLRDLLEEKLVAYTIESLRDVNRHDSCTSGRLLLIKAVDSCRDDRKESGGARPERPKSMLRASQRDRRGINIRKEETLEDLDGR